MADGFDIARPSPDDGHEAIRLAVVEAIENLQFASEDVSFSLSLVDTLFLLLDEALTQVNAVNIRCDALQIDKHTAFDAIDALQARVDALEALTNPLPGPDFAG